MEQARSGSTRHALESARHALRSARCRLGLAGLAGLSALAGLALAGGCKGSGGGDNPVVLSGVPTALQATYGMELSYGFEAAGGTPPYTWRVRDPQRFPKGLELDPATGRIAGSPLRMGSFRFTVEVEDQEGRRRREEVNLEVGPPDFSTRGREILMNGEPFFLRGIDYGPFIAGDAPWRSVKNANPFDDLREIKEVLNANVIRVYQVLPQSVYDAARENGLFVVQGFHLQVDAPEPSFSPECLETEVDIFRPRTFKKLKNRVISDLKRIHKYGASDVILSYVMGNEVNFCAQRAAIVRHQDRPRFQGVFYSVPEGPPRLPAVDRYPGDDCAPTLESFMDPHPFQSFIAELADAAAVFEATEHGERHLWGHSTDPNTSIVPSLKDRFAPEIHFPMDMSFLDIVFQNVYPYFPPAVRFLGYREYLEAAAEAYPDVPFVVLECGLSTSPTKESEECAAPAVCGQPEAPHADSYCFGGNSQVEQAEGLLTHWKNATREPRPVAGFFVFEYYDEWWKGSNRSEFTQDIDKPEEWFGIKGVHGTAKDFKVTRKLAFNTVREMFGRFFAEGGFRFLRGDANSDGEVNVSDAVGILRALTASGGEDLPCLDAADLNDDGRVNVTDAVLVFTGLFGPSRDASRGSFACEADAAPDELPACEYPQEGCRG